MKKEQIENVNKKYYNTALSIDNMMAIKRVEWFTIEELSNIGKISQQKAYSNLVALLQFGYVDMKGDNKNLKYKIVLFPKARKNVLKSNKINVERKINEYKSEIKLIDDIIKII